MIQPKFRFVCAVWGTEYTDAYLRLSLPSQLFPGNLPALAASAHCVYRVYTTDRDLEAMRRSPAYQQLSALMPVEVVAINGHDHSGKYLVTTACNRHFIETTAAEGCASVYLCPDVVWADGSFARVGEIARTDTRVLFVEGPRLSKETFVPAALARFGQDDRLGPAITSRQLVSMALDHLHPETQAMCWGGANRANFPAFLFWRVGTSGLLMRQFCANPLMVKPGPNIALPSPTSALDGDYIENLGVRPEEIYTVTDSDDICMADFTSIATRPNSISPGAQTPLEVARWAKWNANPVQHTFVRHKIRLHADELSEEWQPIEAASDDVVAQVLALISHGDLSKPKPPSSLRFLSPQFAYKQLNDKGLPSAYRELQQRLIRALHRVRGGKETSMTMQRR